VLYASFPLGAGVEKILHGTYFHGTYLAFAISQSDRFARAFEPLMSQAEFARLQAIGDVYREGIGPFELHGLPMLLLSNGVYVLELLRALLLVTRKRVFAGFASVALMAMIELAGC
jgi:hypothetical protein